MAIFLAANGFHLPRLSKLSLTFLYNKCSDENVLEILEFFHQYLSHFSVDNQDTYKNDKSSPVLSEPVEHDDLIELLNRLIIRCYSIVDYFASKIISSEEFANLTPEMIGSILWRDTLNVSELAVFNAINQWACQRCKKTCKKLTDSNKRVILDELIFCPRYLTMNLEDFMKGPYTSEILNVEEKQILLNKIKSNYFELPKYMQLFKMDIQRHYETLEEEYEEVSSATDLPNEEKVDIEAKQVPKACKKKKSKSKKILNGIGEVVLCVIKLLD